MVVIVPLLAFAQSPEKAAPNYIAPKGGEVEYVRIWMPRTDAITVNHIGDVLAKYRPMTGNKELWLDPGASDAQRPWIFSIQCDPEPLLRVLNQTAPADQFNIGIMVGREVVRKPADNWQSPCHNFIHNEPGVKSPLPVKKLVDAASLITHTEVKPADIFYCPRPYVAKDGKYDVAFEVEVETGKAHTSLQVINGAVAGQDLPLPVPYLLPSWAHTVRN